MKEETNVTELDFDLNELLDGASNNIINVEEVEKKPNMFAKPENDLDFVDDIKPGSDLEKENLKKEVAAIIDETTEQDEEEVTSKGRPKVSKDGLSQLVSKLIDKKILIPFEDDKPTDEYSMEDYEELLLANLEEKEKKLQEEIPMKFFDSLPDEMKYAAKYIADGGKDLKSLFRALAQVEEVKSLDPTEDADAETIVKNYLHATKFGNAEEIQEEIDAWKDRNELESKARKFKPKLDAMHEEVVAYQVQENEKIQKLKQEQANMYVKNVYDSLKDGQLNDVKLDKKKQTELFNGLTVYDQQSANGRPTNMLGKLLEKHQFVEPNHSLVAEALWLLSDPEGYRAKIKEVGQKGAVEKVVRQLKTEEGRKIATVVEEREEQEKKKEQKIARPSKNFFKF